MDPSHSGQNLNVLWSWVLLFTPRQQDTESSGYVAGRRSPQPGVRPRASLAIEGDTAERISQEAAGLSSYQVYCKMFLSVERNSIWID